MHDDPSTLEMLKKVSVRGLRWCLVERATHLLLAVVVGYWIGRNEKSEPEKQMQRVEARAAELLKAKNESGGNNRFVGRRDN
jgi:hypothetical protein